MIGQSSGWGLIIGGGQHNTIQCNFIGTDATGTASHGNYEGGVNLNGAAYNLIGTNGDGIHDEAERNLLSGNENGSYWGAAGIAIWGVGSDYNVVAGNYIGTDVTGTLPLGNTGGNNDGIGVWIGSQHNLIGTNGDGIADTAERNVIAANGLNGGIVISGTDAQFNVVAGNYIGTDVTGTQTLGFQVYGVSILGRASYNRIGTDANGIGDAAEGNLISGNPYAGVCIGDSDSSPVSYNTVFGNRIGVAAADLTPLGSEVGVLIESAVVH